MGGLRDVAEGGAAGQRVLAGQEAHRCGGGEDRRISERTIYALEDASRAPSADIFLALQQVLPELCDPEYMRPAFRKADIKVMLVTLP
ncbi:MAG: hypothetical protein ACLUVF_07150 [Adlercreutzia sp.]